MTSTNQHCQMKVGNSHKMKIMTRCEMRSVIYNLGTSSQFPKLEVNRNPEDRWCCQNYDDQDNLGMNALTLYSWKWMEISARTSFMITALRC